MIYNVDSPSALVTALKYAQGGDTIKLAAGDYGTPTLTGFKFDTPVRIESANPNDPAVFETLNLRSVTGITVSNVEFSVESGQRAMEIASSKNVVVEGVYFHGDVGGSTDGEGDGVRILNSEGVTIERSEFQALNSAISHQNSQHVKIADSKFHEISYDAVRGGGSSYVEISGNFFTNIYRPGDEHPDAIQFWTTNTKAAAHDILVANNVFVRGEGKPVQGIFMKDESGKMPYENVTIVGNAIVGAAYNGIAIQGGKGVEISDNLVSGYSDMTSWIRVDFSTNVKVTGNDTTSIVQNKNGAGVVLTDNDMLAKTAVGDTSALAKWLLSHPETVSVLNAGLPESPLGLKAQFANLAEPDMHVIAGDRAANALVGGASSDLLDGREGADTLTGGDGNDVYIVDSTADRTIELAGGGIDTVKTALSATIKLQANVENLILTGTRGQNAVGNGLDNVIVSNGVTGKLDGGAGNDTLVVTGGTQTLTGGTGADVFQFSNLPSKPTVITDFQRGVDKLDLSPLLSAYEGANPVADGWVKFQANGAGGVSVFVDMDGHGAAQGFAEVASISGAGSLGSGDWLF